MTIVPDRPPGRPSADHARDEELLTEVLHDVVRASDGDAAVELLDEAVALGRAARSGDETGADRLAELVAGLELERTEVLVRSLTLWFQLVNLAEDNERVRRIRRRDANEAPAPRPGSLRQVIARLAERGITGSEVADLLRGAELRLVMTAHPTEARRRTTINKLARVFGVLRNLDETSHVDATTARRRVLATVQELWGSDDLRASSLTVLDEVRGGLIHFTSTSKAFHRSTVTWRRRWPSSSRASASRCRHCSASDPGSAAIGMGIRTSPRRRRRTRWS